MKEFRRGGYPLSGGRCGDIMTTSKVKSKSEIIADFLDMVEQCKRDYMISSEKISEADPRLLFKGRLHDLLFFGRA